ncbi:unnamed protein product [Clavelina lepadiformis]|uniref:Uncharacterized protein n=1 Tax=Clavelina lepadiformis TaxID=159417 RepID=A0ABP0FT62_CLALP
MNSVFSACHYAKILRLNKHEFLSKTALLYSGACLLRETKEWFCSCIHTSIAKMTFGLVEWSFFPPSRFLH